MASLLLRNTKTATFCTKLLRLSNHCRIVVAEILSPLISLNDWEKEQRQLEDLLKKCHIKGVGT